MEQGSAEISRIKPSASSDCQSGSWAKQGGLASCPSGSSYVSSIKLCVDSPVPTVASNYIDAGKYCASRGMLIPTMGQMDAVQVASASIPGWAFNQYYVVPWTGTAHFSCGTPGTSTYCSANIWSASGYAICVKIP